jgi:hypothetical protein
VALAHLQGSQYRLESSSLFGEPQVFYGDIVEIEMTGERTGLFRRIVGRSGFRVLDRLLGSQITDSPLFQPMLDQIVQLGGNWERFFGGFLLIHIPPGAEFDLDGELNNIARSG